MGSNVVNFLTECSPRTQETTLLSSSCNSIEDDLRFELPSVANVGSFLSKLSAEAFARYCVTREDGFRNWQDWNIYPFAATRAIFFPEDCHKTIALCHFVLANLPTLIKIQAPACALLEHQFVGMEKEHHHMWWFRSPFSPYRKSLTQQIRCLMWKPWSTVDAAANKAQVFGLQHVEPGKIKVCNTSPNMSPHYQDFWCLVGLWTHFNVNIPLDWSSIKCRCFDSIKCCSGTHFIEDWLGRL